MSNDVTIVTLVFELTLVHSLFLIVKHCANSALTSDGNTYNFNLVLELTQGHCHLVLGESRAILLQFMQFSISYFPRYTLGQLMGGQKQHGMCAQHFDK